MTRPAHPIIVALDVRTTKEALRMVEELQADVSFFKIGLQLYTAAGPEAVREVIATGARVFLDLKLHDIPNTVAGAVESAGRLGVQMLTIHLSGGRAMIEAAMRSAPPELTLLGVTVLTSMEDATLAEIGVSSNATEQVLRLAALAESAGIRGLVCSPREVKNLRERFGGKFELVIPGVRPAGAEAADQKRVMTPRETLVAGANYLVIGRPITANPSPRDALTKILEEIRG